MPQYSDIPAGAEVIEYSDLPPGAEVVTEQKPSAPVLSAPSAPVAPEKPYQRPSFSDLQSSPSLGAMGGMTTRKADFQAAGQVLKEEGKGVAYGASAVAPIVTGGASIPIQMLVNAASGGVQSATTGGSVKQVATSTVLGAGLGALSGAIPRVGDALATLKRLAGVAPESAVPLKNAVGPTIDILKEASSGGSQPKVISDLIKRINKGGPLTYEEARRFYSNASRISADEAGKLTDSMKRLLGNFREAMHQDIVANRSAYGAGEAYDQAIKQYAAAKSFQGAAAKTAKIGGAAVGTGMLGNLGWRIAQAMQGGHGR